MRTRFEGMVPILRVANLAASLDYYQRVLGFAVDWQHQGVFGSVTRDRATLYLCQGDQGLAGGWVWIGVGDVEIVHQEYRSAGAKIRHPPTSYPWAHEMQVSDLDGNVLRLGSEPRQDLPPGDWLDMYGRVWPAAPADPSSQD